MTTLRLATSGTIYTKPGWKSLRPDMTEVRLATAPIPGHNASGFTPAGSKRKASLLVSYFYLSAFEKIKEQIEYRDWVMDSGAFSAHHSGAVIDLKEYTEHAKMLLTTDPTLTEVFGLDVIGDYQASLKNVEQMWEDGVPAIPTFHYGSPFSALKHIAKEYPKIALGGAVGLNVKTKTEWAKKCFNMIWPCRVHGFGFGSERSMLAVPFHSTDATNWESQPTRYGSWKSFNGAKLSIRGSNQQLRLEVEYYLNLEERVKHRWAAQMKELDELPGNATTLRLAFNNETRTLKTFGKEMTDGHEGSSAT